MLSNIHVIVKNLRKRSTDAERLLWKHLRAKQLEGLKFRRQQPIGNYIADFVCFENGLVIELDGEQHVKDKEKDVERDKWFERRGYKVIRFWNNEVLQNIEVILERIKEVCLFHPPPTPPFKGGG